MKSNQPKRSRPAPASARRRIFLLDDHPITRYGLTQLLNQEPDLVVCGDAENVRQAFSAIKPPLPDLVVADVGLPGNSVIEFLKDLRVLHPGVPVLILSTHDETVYAERLIKAGARGYIMKSEGGANLLKAVRQVLAGRPYISEAMSAKVFDVFAEGGACSAGSLLSQLTDREFEVFQVIGQGKSNREVAQQLCISPKTVEAHRLSLCSKLNLKTPAQLIRYAVQCQERETRLG